MCQDLGDIIVDYQYTYAMFIYFVEGPVNNIVTFTPPKNQRWPHFKTRGSCG